MKVLEILDEIDRAPGQLLDSHCALSLGAFVHGYKMADVSIDAAVQRMSGAFAGPSGANGFMKAFLQYGGGERAYIAAMNEFRAILASEPAVSPTASAVAHLLFINIIAEPIQQKRYGLVLGEPTISWVANCYHGYLVGLGQVLPERAQYETRLLDSFECWLRQYYGMTVGTWHGLLRIFEGPCGSGLARFVELWSEFRAELGQP